MPQNRRTTKEKEIQETLADRLNQVPSAKEGEFPAGINAHLPDPDQLMDALDEKFKEQVKKDKELQKEVEKGYSELFDRWESDEFAPNDFKIDVPIDSLESRVGYSSLIRQLQDSYSRTIAFYRSFAGGSLPPEEARKRAFHHCEDSEEAKKIFNRVMSYPLENVSFDSLHELYGYAPRVAERLWEEIKEEGRSEFESGHLAANTMSPVHYMKQAWSIAKYLGVRESFVNDWQPKGGIELSLIDMLAQTFFQWQYWLEETVKRSQTKPREEHYEYQKWKQHNERTRDAHSWQDGYWFPPYVHEQQAIEHAVQMADRFNRIYMRTLRQLRDLRRYAPLTINNANQVNIANDGSQQINMAKT